MLRTALRPRSLALLALALAVAAAFAGLGQWQLDRARSQGEARAAQEVRAAQGPVPLEEVLAPATTFTAGLVGTAVTVEGSFRPGSQVVAADRGLDGAAGEGSWVLVALDVPQPAGGTAVLPVVRGWLPAGAPVPAPPAGEATVTGRLAAGEAPVGLPAGATPGDVGPLESVSPADLANLWGPPVYTGLLLAADPPRPLQEVPAPAGGGGLALVNVSYALQWWVFGGFAVFLWWRTVREDHLRRAAPEPVREDEPARPPVPQRGAPP